MVAFPIIRRLKRPSAATVAILAGTAVACALLFVPIDLIEGVVSRSGLPALFPAAEPPLGSTARMALAITLGSGIGAVAWFALTLLWGDAAATPAPVQAAGVPVLRRADAHPDAPPRPPLLATRDLGDPFADTVVPILARVSKPEPAPEPILIEQPLPRDLDAPLAAFDPTAIPAAPATPSEPVAPLFRPRPIPCEPGERIEAFELRPPVRPVAADAPAPIAAPRTDASIHALLERLERGVAARTTRETDTRPTTIDDALAELRRMATR
ncbi:hypothetical protein SAMN06297144_1636 [Sphingomonas guangdongensis]|uniref:Uncharacterized protein n=1 Tax=Sphingomonas guangdongensis TaxID=1141890 RepID=A0A285QX37_9SPHN|nr:hypothetical protein [Sphingomonas guangdongensis]SOB86530.1 hypothetical protein SAMN06297144_1636 [Sphingomonas guangdongensis]